MERKRLVGAERGRFVAANNPATDSLLARFLQFSIYLLFFAYASYPPPTRGVFLSFSIFRMRPDLFSFCKGKQKCIIIYRHASLL